MKPQKLSLQAFGPFWNRAEIDFSQLQQGGLFLIHGPVGSGKTSLLDALCFALYGISSGGERAPQQLRCDLAPESLPTRVEFQFEAEAVSWTVVRLLSPEGTRVELHSAQGPSHPISDPQARIQQLVGLDAFQFCRAVLLPQGQFRQFLLSGSQEREQILSALFHTHAPRLYQETLAQAVEELEEQLSLAWNRRERSLQPEEPGQRSLHDDLRWHQEQLRQLESQLNLWQKQRQQLHQDQQRAAIVGERSRELERVRRQRQELESQRNKVEELKTLTVRLQAALKVAPQVEQWRRAQSEEEEALEGLREAEQQLRRRLEGLASPQDNSLRLEELQAQRANLKSQLQRLEDSEGERLRLSQAEERLSRCRQSWNQLEEEGLWMEKEREAAQTRLRQLEQYGAEEQELQEQLKEQQAQLEHLRRQVKQQRQQEEFHQGIERVQHNLERLAERRNRSLSQIETLEQQLQERTRLLEQHWSSTLARRLEDRQPCPVCGSLEHPAPTPPPSSATPASQEQLRKQLEHAWKQAETIDEEEKELLITRTRLEERLQVAQESSSLERSAEKDPDRERLQNITERLRELEKKLQQLQHVRRHEERDRRRLSKLKKRLKHWKEDRESARQALTQAEAIVEERRARLAEPLEDDLQSRLREELEEIEERVKDQALQLSQDTHLYATFAGAAEAARRNIELCQQRTQMARELVEARLELEKFADLESWEAAHRQAQDELSSLLKELHSLLSQQQLLEEEEERAQQLYHESLEDWQELAHPPHDLEEHIENAYQEKARLQEALRVLQRQIEDYERALIEIQVLEPRLAQFRHFLRVAQGDNPRNLSFQQWVLSQQMEKVLQAANRHLGQMTAGRFSLESGDSALELQVRDHLSAQMRAVATLSGGESFLASLALALGLSDGFLEAGREAIVQTLFIDEGFGSLDEEGLEQALQALEPLGKDGRILGLVSHLAELRQRIPNRLEILPTPSGNRLIWSSGG